MTPSPAPHVCVKAPGAGYARTGEWENGERNADCQEDQQ